MSKSTRTSTRKQKEVAPQGPHRYRVVGRYVETTEIERFVLASSPDEAVKLTEQRIDIETLRGTPRGLVRGTRVVKLSGLKAEEV
jgi:hypothetical protein